MSKTKTEYYREYRARKHGKPTYSKEDMEECLICGEMYVLLGTHVYKTHGVFMADYKEEFGLDRKRGRTRGQFKELKAKRVRDTGTIKNLEKGAKYRFKKGGPVPKYERRPETTERLRKQGKRLADEYGGKDE